MTDDDFLPGCYLHLSPPMSESFAGYLLRLAAANSYAGIADFLKSVYPGKLSTDLAKAFQELRTSRESLKMLGRVGAGDARALMRFLWQQLPDGAIYYQDCRIEPDSLLSRSAQVCPRCLEEAGMALEDWDLAPVVACPKHDIALLDTCTCGEPITWRRHQLHFCNCGNDLRELPVAGAGLELKVPSADFASLAPFRAQLVGMSSESVRWDSMFLVLKSASLRAHHWTCDEWPEGIHFRELPWSERAVAVATLGRCQAQGTYHLAQLSGQLFAPLTPLQALPVPNLARTRAFNILFSKAALPKQVASTLTRHVPTQERSGADIHHGRPPVLRTRADVVQFLETDDESFSGLLARKVIYLPSGADLGFDIDVVLHAQRFLREGLFTPEQLGLVVGAPAEPDAIRGSLLLRPWNSKSALDARVEVGDVEAIHLRLAEIAASSAQPQRPIKLMFASQWTLHPFRWTLEMVGRLMDGQAERLSWSEPYRWGDLCVEVEFAAAHLESGSHAALLGGH